MEFKLISLVLAFLSFFSCNHRCNEAMDDTRGQKRDTALCYLWRYTDSYRTSSIDSGYLNFKTNGDFETAYTLNHLKQGKVFVWSSLDGSYSYVGCQDNGSATGSTLKYIIKGDSLTINYSSGEHPRFMKVSKPIP